MSDNSAVGYMRCSSVGQTEGDTWNRQIAAIQSCCKLQGLELIREYREEGIPGKLGEESRPAFQKMVSDLLGNGCRTIVIEGLDRLARQYDIQQQLATYLASKGLTLISANTGEDITAALMGDPMRRALVQIQGVFSELDKNLLIAKLRKARDRKKKANGVCEGRKPFGLDPSKPWEAEHLTVILSLRGEGLTCEAIADELNAQHIPTRMAGKTIRGKMSSGKWRACTIHRILTRKEDAGHPNPEV